MKCPNCGRGNFGFTGSLDFILKPVADDEKLTMVCNICKWVGFSSELVSDEEFKNIKRSKLIDKMTE